MRKSTWLTIAMVFVMILTALTGCGTEPADSSSAVSSSAESSGRVASASDMADVEDVVEEGMVPVYADQISEGVYEVEVDSSSSMFSIESCSLTVEQGEMSAVMTMGGKGYLYVFMGTGEEAVAAEESAYIPFEETEGGAHTFTVPVEALDKGIACAAFSKKKEMWYDRTLVFRADSLPEGALRTDVYKTAGDLQLTDGAYTAPVTLEGGSGKASVTSPAELRIADGEITAVIEWSSPNYDYMVVNGERYEPVNTDGNSVFEIPVPGFDHPVSVSADTTAMSTPHEIDYTLTFDSAGIAAE